MPSLADDLHGRIGGLGLIVLGVLVLLLSRLWYLQVLEGQTYAARAEDNRLKSVTEEAPRGLVLDRDGAVIVGNRPALAVTVPPKTLENTRLVTRLAAVLGVPRAQIIERLKDERPSPLKPRRIVDDAPLKAVTTIRERTDLFPSRVVEVAPISVRRYPFGRLASHALGYVGELSDWDMRDSDFKDGYDYGDIVGKTGIERRYEDVLQGTKGTTLLEVDARGRPLRRVRTTEPNPGRTVMLTIDRKVQETTEKQLAEALKAARRDKYKKARAGAAVVMDVRTGEILAIASYPTYDPSAFLSGIPTPVWKRLNDPKSEYPLFNRAITGAYPPGSTFKPVTASAGLATHVVTLHSSVDCEGRWIDMGKQWPKWCWNKRGHGTEDFMDAMADSCDVYFYDIGLSFYRRDGAEVREELQRYARDFGFGDKTGIDLAGEVRGRIPDRKWKVDFNKNSPEYAPWLPGDTVNLAIGQGDVLATPIQIVRMYAAIANGGKLMKPYLVSRILTPSGEMSHSTKPTVTGTLPLSNAQLKQVQQALLGVIERGTAAGAFEGFPYRVAGKTGTSQVTGKDDYALFAGYAPYDDPKWAAVVIVEQGGHGGSVAAPAVRNIFASLMGAQQTWTAPEDESR